MTAPDDVTSRVAHCLDELPPPDDAEAFEVVEQFMQNLAEQGLRVVDATPSKYAAPKNPAAQKDCLTCGGTGLTTCLGPSSGCYGMHMSHTCPCIENARLRAAIAEAVRNLKHDSHPGRSLPWCVSCGLAWPCPSRMVADTLAEALGGKS